MNEVTKRKLSPEEANIAFMDATLDFHCKTRKDAPPTLPELAAMTGHKTVDEMLNKEPKST